MLFGYAAILGLLGPIGRVWVVPSSPALTYVIGWLWMLFAVGAALTVSRCPGWWFSLRRWPWSSRTPPVAVVVGALGAVLLGVVASDIFERVLGEWGLIDTTDGAGIDAVAGWIDVVIWITAEELLVVAIPVTVMRYFRVPTPWALLALVILGLVPSLYLGHIGIWTMFPWVAAAAAVYWRWPSVTVLAGLVAIAIAYNVGLTVGGSYSLVVFGGVGLVALVVAFELERRWYRHFTIASTPTVSLRRRRQA
ncbi:hypothetical protein [Gordonia sp. NPDC127522]|uniref:hypothetical protein n=1 Tax=Gordonia sp. NPDC127522 TaxID=3345390 RepID=UPI00363CF073